MSRNRIFGLTNRVLMMIPATLLVASYVSIMINPAAMWVMSVVGLMFVPLAILNTVLLVWAVLRRSKAFMIPLLAMLPAVFFLGRFVRFEESEDKAVADVRPLKMISWNVGRFDLDELGLSDEECADSVFTFLQQQNADIVCLQELRLDGVINVRRYLEKKMKGYKCEYYLFEQKGCSFGNVTFSRMKVLSGEAIKFKNSTNIAIYSDYEFEGHPFRVYNCHFESYNVSFTGIMRSILGEGGEELTETGARMKRSITRRPKQVDQVFANIETSPVPSFVCGDFNDTPMSYTYYRLMRGRSDTFVEAGDGFGATYAKMWPLLRIDYILCPEFCEVISHKTPRVNLSDHYPVVTEIIL